MEHFNKLLSRFVLMKPHGRSYKCITGIMYAQTHIHVSRNKWIVARFCILMNLIFTYLISWNKSVYKIMVLIAYASSEGSDEPAHPRKIASALTAHIHNEGACRGCEFKISKALEMIGTSRNSLYLPYVCRSIYPDFVTWEDQPAHRTVLSAPLFLEQNMKHFVRQVLGPNCLLN